MSLYNVSIHYSSVARRQLWSDAIGLFESIHILHHFVLDLESFSLYVLTPFCAASTTLRPINGNLGASGRSQCMFHDVSCLLSIHRGREAGEK